MSSAAKEILAVATSNVGHRPTESEYVKLSIAGGTRRKRTPK